MVKFTFNCFCVVFNVHLEGVPSKLDNATSANLFPPSVVAPALVSLDVPQYAIAHSLVAPSHAKKSSAQDSQTLRPGCKLPLTP